MARGEKKEAAEAPENAVEVAGDAHKAPREQTVGDTDQPQMNHAASAPKVNEGEQEAIVNPSLDTLSVSIPVGYSEDGLLEADNFNKGATYYVDPKLLEVFNTEGVPLLVDPKEYYGGGE